MIAMRSTDKMNLEKELPQRKRAASPNKLVMMREDLRICKWEREKSIRYHHSTGGPPLKRQPATVDIQDNPASISYYQEPPPELKWDKERRGPAPWRSLE